MRNTEQLTRREFFYAVQKAVESTCFDDAEELRDYVKPEFSDILTRMYFELDDWWQKELIIHIVQDDLSEAFSDIMLDAINAPSAESKAYSICYRKQDRSLLNKYIVNYEVSPKLVEKDAREYLPKQKKWWRFGQ